MTTAVAQVRQHMAQGVSEARIREHFMRYGWHPHQLDAVFQSINNDGFINQATKTTPRQPLTQQPSIQPAKYTVRRSLADVFRALRANPRANLLAIATGTAVYLLGFALVGLLISLGIGASNHNSIAASLALLFIILLLPLVWYAVASSFFMAITGFALQSGTGQATSYVVNLRRSVRATPRAAAASTLSLIYSYLPLYITVCAAFASLINAFASGGSDPTVTIILGLMFLFSVAWILIAGLRLALVQQVAIFEPQLRIRHTLARSRYLLRSGGQWFLVKAFCLLVIALIPLILIAGGSLRKLIETQNMTLNIVLALIAIISQSVLAMLYFNRAAVRDVS